MDFEIPKDLADYLDTLDEFIDREIRPLEEQDDNIRFFDHRREDARTDWERGGLPNGEWMALLAEARRRADAAGHYRYPFPEEYGGRDGTNLGMAVIREHLARQRPRPAQRPAERALDRRQQRRAAADDPLRHRRAAGRVGRRPRRGPAGLRLRDHRARPRLGRHPHGDPRRARRRRVGDRRREDVEHRHARGPVRPDLRPDQRPGRRRRRHHLLPRPDRQRRVRDRRVPVDVQHAHRPRPHAADRRPGPPRGDLRRRGARACRWCSTSSTRTASARRPRAWGPPSSASTGRSSTPRCARRSASRSPPTRRSSSRSSSCRRSARCCGRSSTRPPG